VRELRTSNRPWFAVWHLWELHEPRQVPSTFNGKALSRTVYDRALAALDARLATLFPDESLMGITVCLIGDHGENLRFEPRGKIGQGIASLLWFKSTRWLTQPFARRVIAYGAHSSSKRVLRAAPRHIITHGHHLFEPLLRVPYIIAGDEITPGSSDALVTHVDLAPTFAALAGTWFQGGAGSLPLPLQGEGAPDRRIVLETAWATPLQGVRQIGLRTPRWKYMELEEGGAAALFDLEEDPDERRNLAERLPKVAGELRAELRSLIAEPGTAGHMSADDAGVVEDRLRELGYL
jgi:arylsulfatase A-like enzyme